MSVRGANESSVTEFRWTAFLMIACNKGCLPSIDSSDIAFVNRMVTVPMRSKFNNAASADGVPLSFPIDTGLQEKLRSARDAIMQVLIQAYGRYQDVGNSFGELPASCLELRASIISDSDPRLELVNGVIESEINFSEIDSAASDTVYTLKSKSTRFVERTSLIEAIVGHDHSGILKKVKKSVLKDIVDSAMAARGRPVEPRIKIDGQDLYNVFKDCSWREM